MVRVPCQGNHHHLLYILEKLLTLWNEQLCFHRPGNGASFSFSTRFTQTTWAGEGRLVPTIPPSPLTLPTFPQGSKPGAGFYSGAQMQDHSRTRVWGDVMVNETALSPTGRREKGLCAHNKDKNVSLPITACVTWTVFPSRFLSQSKFTSCKGSKVWSIHQVFNIYSREALPKLKKKKIFLITLFLISSFNSQRKCSQY